MLLIASKKWYGLTDETPQKFVLANMFICNDEVLELNNMMFAIMPY